MIKLSVSGNSKRQPPQVQKQPKTEAADVSKFAINVDSKISTVDINKIKLWKNNPRKNDAAAPKVAEILKTRGQVHPIVVCRKTNVCYAGNTRIKAAKILGWKTIKVIYVDFPSEQAAIAYGIADNKSSEYAEWDDDILKNFLQMKEMANMSGFTITETAGLFGIKLEHASKTIDYDELWQGLPEYSDNVEKPFKSVVIHFKTEEDFKKFNKITAIGMTSKTRSTWYPKKDRVAVQNVLAYKGKED
jgi:hypothetical protein